MAIEQERKFLVSDKPMDLTKWSYTEIEQGYLMLAEGKQLRIRIERFQHALIPPIVRIAFKSDIREGVKHEFEYRVPYEDGITMMKESIYKVHKKRWTTYIEGNTVSLDQYEDGLRIIEVEYENYMDIPDFCGKEVTGVKEYSNIAIAKKGK